MFLRFVQFWKIFVYNVVRLSGNTIASSDQQFLKVFLFICFKLFGKVIFLRLVQFSNTEPSNEEPVTVDLVLPKYVTLLGITIYSRE